MVRTEFRDGYNCPKGKRHASKFECFLSRKCGDMGGLGKALDQALKEFDPLHGSILRADHLKAAFELPKSHGVREVVIDACVPSYLQAFSFRGEPFLQADSLCYEFIFKDE